MRTYSFLLMLILIYPLTSHAHLIYDSGDSREYYDSNGFYDDTDNIDSYDGSRAHGHRSYYEQHSNYSNYYEVNGSPYATQSAPLPAAIRAPLEKVIIIDPNEHAWGAYSSQGKLLRWGIATAGNDWCYDINKPCRTRAGAFRIYSMGDETCFSRKFPVPVGGAPMPYCMYFNGGQALHGSNEVVYDNVSHGCVRIHVSDARWLRYKFVEGPNSSNQFRGTKVIIRPY